MQNQGVLFCDFKPNQQANGAAINTVEIFSSSFTSPSSQFLDWPQVIGTLAPATSGDGGGAMVDVPPVAYLTLADGLQYASASPGINSNVISHLISELEHIQCRWSSDDVLDGGIGVTRIAVSFAAKQSSASTLTAAAAGTLTAATETH